MAAPTYHDRNIAAVLEHALRLAEEAGNEADACRRAELIAAAMAAWRCAQSLRRWPGTAARS